MSKQGKETITCPQCGQENEWTVWESLNADLDPQIKQHLLDGTLFQFECQSCGYQSIIDYPLLYHDMAHQVMIYYVAEDAVAQTQSMFDEVESNLGVDMPNYRKRIVTSQNALREKALIFDHNLDDRIIEIIKLLYLSNAITQFPDKNIAAIFFAIDDDGKYILEFMSEEPLWAEVPTPMYEQVSKDFANYLASTGDTETIIDLDWAQRLLYTE